MANAISPFKVGYPTTSSLFFNNKPNILENGARKIMALASLVLETLGNVFKTVLNAFIGVANGFLSKREAQAEIPLKKLTQEQEGKLSHVEPNKTAPATEAPVKKETKVELISENTSNEMSLSKKLALGAAVTAAAVGTGLVVYYKGPTGAYGALKDGISVTGTKIYDAGSAVGSAVSSAASSVTGVISGAYETVKGFVFGPAAAAAGTGPAGTGPAGTGPAGTGPAGTGPAGPGAA